MARTLSAPAAQGGDRVRHAVERFRARAAWMFWWFLAAIEVTNHVVARQGRAAPSCRRILKSDPLAFWEF